MSSLKLNLVFLLIGVIALVASVPIPEPEAVPEALADPDPQRYYGNYGRGYSRRGYSGYGRGGYV